MKNIYLPMVALSFILPAIASGEMQLEKFISAYPGSVLYGGYPPKIAEFDRYELLTGPIDSATAKTTATQMVEGRTTKFAYENPKERTEFEIFANYREAVGKAGFKTIYTCIDAECFADGKPSNNVGNVEKGLGWFPQAGTHYIAGKLATPDGELLLSLHVQRHRTDFHYILLKPMQTNQVKVDAAALKSVIESEGHVAVYGIVFDTAKADLKPESAAAIAEIVKLLKENVALNIYVVGHTDSVGTLDSNLALSRRRAEAVVLELTAKHAIVAQRLRPDGVGPLCPLATNGTDAGRTKNRRVDLVKQ